MTQTGTQSAHPVPEADGLSDPGLIATGRVFRNLASAALCERAVARGEARLADTGALAVTTAAQADDLRHYVVRDEADDDASSAGAGEARLSRVQFEALKADLLAHTANRTLFAQDVRIDAGPGRRLRLRILSEQAWHSLLARHLMAADDSEATPDVTLLCAPGFRPDPGRDGVDAAAAVAVDLDKGVALVAGTAATEALRGAVFTFLAHRLPERNALPLPAAATAGPTGEVALFLGSSGAGKTALAGDATHARIGDGMLAWTAEGLVPLETGLSARAADLPQHPDAEAAARRFGAVLENVAVDSGTRTADFAEGGSAAHARAIVALAEPRSAPLRAPAHLFLLVHDTFGVLPPIARLSPAQALQHFLCGYGAGEGQAPSGKSAGAAPAARFAPCFSPALPHGAETYGTLLRDLLARHEPTCWLVNTGWIGGQAGAGRRVPLETSRRLVDAAQAGELAAGEWRTDPHFGIAVPAALEGIEAALLDPAKAWANRVDHAIAARRLAGLFAARFAPFEQAFGKDVQTAQPGMVLAAE